jgi:hypothetical protein
MQPSLYPNQSLDDVYRQLRDSTDNLANVFDPTSAAAAAPDAGAYAVQCNTHADLSATFDGCYEHATRFAQYCCMNRRGGTL